MVIILNTSLNNSYLNEYTKFKLLIAAKNGVSVYQNQINLIKNLKVNREKYISIKSIFFNYWDEFVSICKKKNKQIRSSIIEAVDKMIHCKDFSKGYFFYECPKCNNFYVAGISCNSRFCSSCGNRYRNDRTREISKVCLNKPHRQFVFSIAEELRPYFRYHRELYDILFKSVEEAFEYLIRGKSKIAKIEKRDLGYISFLHTYGRDVKDNPHIHVLICEGYMDSNNLFHKYEHFNYETLRKAFMKQLLDNIYHFLKKNAQEKTKKFYELKCYLYKKYPYGFYAHGPKLKQNTRISIKAITKYVARYVSHPAIAESRITSLDYVNKTITYYYEPHEDDHVDDPNQKMGTQYVTESVFTFIAKLIRHIPDKYFHLVRYYGFYSNRTLKNKDKYQSLYTNQELIKIKNDNYWINHLIATYKYNPLLCHCGAYMNLSLELSYLPKGG